MLQDLSPESDLLQPVAASKLARRSRLHEHVVVVEVVRPPLALVGARRLLVVDVGHVLFAEGAVVKPVVAHPAIDHGIHGHGDFQRRVRIHQRHQRQKSVVGDAEDADLAIALGNIFHQPVDGVVGVGGVIDRRGIQRAVQRTVHDVVALGAILAAHVLHHADVAAFDDDFGSVVIAVQDRAKMGTFGMADLCRGIVRGAREQDWRALRALGTTITVCSFTPSRIGIITSRLM